MAGNESIHKTLERVRKPRVHITYEVYTGDAIELKEVPFVVGVMGDFSGDPTEELKPLSERKFIEIDRDNFDDVLKRMTPGLELKVDNTLKDDGSQMSVNLKFESMGDFSPANIVDQVTPLHNLKQTRDKLRDLLSRADRSEKLEQLLENVLQNTEQRDQLASDLDIDPSQVGGDATSDSGSDSLGSEPGEDK